RTLRLSPPRPGAPERLCLRRGLPARRPGGDVAEAAAAAIRAEPRRGAGLDGARGHRGDGRGLWRRAAARLCRDARRAAPFHRVVRGFDRQPRGLVESEFAVSIDGGAGRGGRLIAAAFAPDGTVLEVLQV